MAHPNSRETEYDKIDPFGLIHFDQFTGATNTPRAIVSATYQVLDLFSKQGLLNNK